MKNTEVKEKRWLVWDYVNEYPFEYQTRKEAVKYMNIFNKERNKFDKKYYLFKRV